VSDQQQILISKTGFHTCVGMER